MSTKGEGRRRGRGEVKKGEEDEEAKKWIKDESGNKKNRKEVRIWRKKARKREEEEEAKKGVKRIVDRKEEVRKRKTRRKE